MKIGQTAKQIDSIVTQQGYKYNRNFGDYMGACTVWNEKRKQWDKVNSTFVARKYSQIIDLIQQTKAAVTIKENTILINYGNGSASIGIDELVKSVLIPELKKITPIN